MIHDIGKRPFITIGMATWTILFLLGITSNRFSIRKLGRALQSLHRLVYVAGILAVIHFWWLVKADITLPRRWAFAIGSFLLFRLWWGKPGLLSLRSCPARPVCPDSLALRLTRRHFTATISLPWSLRLVPAHVKRELAR